MNNRYLSQTAVLYYRDNKGVLCINGTVTYDEVRGVHIAELLGALMDEDSGREFFDYLVDFSISGHINTFSKAHEFDLLDTYPLQFIPLELII